MSRRTIFMGALFFLALAMFAALVMYLLAYRGRPAGPEENINATDTLVAIGEAAPDFSAISMNGETIQLSQYRGQPVLLFFFGDNEYDPWFEESLQCIQNVYAMYWEKGLAVVAVDYREQVRILQWMQGHRKFTFPLLVDRGQAISSNYMIHFEPHAFLIDSEGTVRQRLDGGLTENRIENALRPFFAGPQNEGFSLFSLFAPKATATLSIGVRPGQEAPDFQLSDLDGQAVQLSDLRGMPVMLYVLTVGHEIPRTKGGEYRITDLKDLPLVQNVYIRHWEEGLAALGVIDEFTLSIVRSAAWQAGTTFPILQDKHGEIRQRYSGYGDSSVFFIAPDGTILSVIQDQTSEDAYEAGVKKLLEYRDAHQ